MISGESGASDNVPTSLWRMPVTCDLNFVVVAARDVDRLLAFFLLRAERVDIDAERRVANLHEHRFVLGELAVDEFALDEREREIARRVGRLQRGLRHGESLLQRMVGHGLRRGRGVRAGRMFDAAEGRRTVADRRIRGAWAIAPAARFRTPKTPATSNNEERRGMPMAWLLDLANSDGAAHRRITNIV